MKYHNLKSMLWKKYKIIISCFIIGAIAAILYIHFTRTNTACPKCNIVIISIDPLRADNLPCFGYIHNTTPNLCRFANRSNTFTNAYAQSSWTLPSIMSMITSQYPYKHGMLIPYQSVLAADTVTLPQSLKKGGYRTIYIGDTKNSHLPLDKGLGRGFDEIHEYIHETQDMKRFIAKQETNDKPLFMFIHNFDMSASWNRATNPPSTFRFDPTFTPPQIYDPTKFLPVAWKDAIYFLEQKLNLSAEYSRILYLLKNAKSSEQAYIYFKQLEPADQQSILSFSIFEYIDMKNSSHVRLLRNLYDERLSQLDLALAPLLETLTSPPWRDNTIVVIVANHGDELGEHGRMSHGTNLFGSTTHIPLILRIPSSTPKRVNSLVASIDIFPTILELVGIRKPNSVDGESLLPIITNTQNQTKRGYVVAQLGPSPWLSTIRTQSWSYYKDNTDLPPEMLFNIKNDPHEQLNVVDTQRDIAKQLKARLTQINITNKATDSIKP